MLTQPEILYNLRKKYRGAHVLGLGMFTLAWIARSIYKVTNSENERLHLVIFIFLLLSLFYLAFYAIRLNIVEHKINNDPSLKEALHDELFQLHELRAWKTAFFCLMSFNILMAIFSLFVVIDDIMLIFITSFLVGFGSYSLTMYILER